jgi:hypothetical protein
VVANGVRRSLAEGSSGMSTTKKVLIVVAIIFAF